jgi:hypothetical protein
MSIDAFRNPEADAESNFAHAKDLALGTRLALQLLNKQLSQHRPLPHPANAFH